ncbi:MAG TPA: undecaprenyl diphosphate synthase family protein, partial [Mycobacteriales bacterium]|nr:undecaprenyl diphosphate synthase family protein [Mycobacteriales bacterium]
AGELDPVEITEKTVAEQLYIPELPDVDLLLRTSGEHRISNFLLWQAAYAEFVFDDTFFPDFDRAALHRAIAEFAGRHRRYGGV